MEQQHWIWCVMDFIIGDIKEAWDETKIELLNGSDHDKWSSASSLYWVADRGVGVGESTAYWCVGSAGPYSVNNNVVYLCNSLGQEEQGEWQRMRPVVSLKYNVTTDQVPVLSGKPEN